MSRDLNTDDRIKRAAQEALDTKYSWADDWDDAASDHEFSEAFLKKMEKTCRAAEHSYVSLGRFRMMRAAAAALIAAILMVLAGCTYAVTQAVIHWDEAQNDSNGTLDVYFDIDDPDSTLTDKGLRKPETPEGYEIVSEDRDETEGGYYVVEYRRGKKGITYSQNEGVENMGLSIDNDDPGFKEITVNGYKGYSSHDEYGCFMIWTDGVYLYDIGGNCSMDVLEKMAESLK